MTYIDAIKNFAESEHWKLTGYSFTGGGHGETFYAVEISFQNRFNLGSVEFRFDTLSDEGFEKIDSMIRNMRG